MADTKVFDIVIAGSGPAGSACALGLADSGMNIAVVDKASFPRNKICGDALSIDVIRQLPIISDKLPVRFKQLEKKISSSGIRIYGPSGEMLQLSIENNNHECGYVVRRPLFDSMLHECINEIPSLKYFGNYEATSVEIENNHICLNTTKGIIRGKILVGSDGANSIVSKQVRGHRKSKKHLCIGIKSYYRNVEGFHPDGYIELHFYKSLLPCYLWVFPMHENEANVGLGLMYEDLKKSGKNLKQFMFDLIATHPNLAPRFKHAKLISTVEAWPLPLGMNKKIISGDRVLLAGDSAGLIDPFTGEGVGNALRSGRIAAEHILRCFEENNFSAIFNKKYDEEIYRRMWNELRISKSVQKIMKFPKLIDFIVRKANKNQSFNRLLHQAMFSESTKEKIIRNILKK